jgi:hypothetical protein
MLKNARRAILHSPKTSRRSTGFVAVIIASLLLGLMVAAALASGHSTHRLGFAVFSEKAHGHANARASAYQPLDGRAGQAILATEDEHSAIYAWNGAGPNGPDELCVSDDEVTGFQDDTGCAPASYVEAHGLMIADKPVEGSPLSVAVLVPNGTSQVTFVSSNHSSTTVPVVNNVAALEGDSTTSLYYTLGNGAHETVNLAAVAAAARRHQG